MIILIKKSVNIIINELNVYSRVVECYQIWDQVSDFVGSNLITGVFVPYLNNTGTALPMNYSNRSVGDRTLYDIVVCTFEIENIHVIIKINIY